MDYQEGLLFLRNTVLISEVMLGIVLVLMSLVGIVAWRTRAWGLLVFLGGLLPVGIYYAFSSLHLWSGPNEGHVYGRLSFAVLFVTLIVAVKRWERYAILRGLAPGSWEEYPFLRNHVAQIKRIVSRFQSILYRNGRTRDDR